MSSHGWRRRSSVQPPVGPTIVVVTHRGREVTRWPLPGADHPDLALAERLARCQLLARRVGCTLELRDIDARLRELLELLGWCLVVGGHAPDDVPGLLLEPVGQAEDREEAGIDEVVVPDDPVA
jgi:hypothetical protein